MQTSDNDIDSMIPALLGKRIKSSVIKAVLD